MHEKSRSKVSLLRRTAQRWLATYKFSVSELLVTKPKHSWTQIICHGPLRCEASRLGSDPRAGPGVPRQDLQHFSWPLVGLIRTKGRPQQTDEASDPRIQVLAHDLQKGERGCRACSLGKIVGRAKHPSNYCHPRDMTRKHRRQGVGADNPLCGIQPDSTLHQKLEVKKSREEAGRSA